MSNNFDMTIIGGGLAGLSLALQIRNSVPDMDICVLERNLFPVPEKTAKVGESTVEIGSRYLKETLGLKQHFTDRHLRKHGLRCFFGTPQNDFSQQDELGVSQLFGIPTYQIDRGAIENQLHQQLLSLGVTVIDNAALVDFDLGSEKSVSFKRDGEIQKITSKWLIDSAGRQHFLRNKLDLACDNPHKGNAIWFRIDRQVKLDQWTTNQEWQQRIKEPNTRWLSTNHLMGPGYWVWIIPLDNGATSFGIVMDDQAFAEGDFDDFDSTFKWLSEHHPVCAAAIEGAEILDFVAIKDYARSSKQLFNDSGWGMTGEAGIFSDPFYSPGSDFIAFANSFLTDLTQQWKQGQDIRIATRVYDQLLQSFFASTLSLYKGNYGGFGDRRMMSLKLVWDYAYYWGVLSVLFFRESLTDINLLRSLSSELRQAQQTNFAVQALFSERAKERNVLPAQGLFMNQYRVPCLQELSRRLETNQGCIKTELAENIATLERLAQHIGALLNDTQSPEISDCERELLGDYRHAVLA